MLAGHIQVAYSRLLAELGAARIPSRCFFLSPECYLVIFQRLPGKAPSHLIGRVTDFSAVRITPTRQCLPQNSFTSNHSVPIPDHLGRLRKNRRPIHPGRSAVCDATEEALRAISAFVPVSVSRRPRPSHDLMHVPCRKSANTPSAGFFAGQLRRLGVRVRATRTSTHRISLSRIAVRPPFVLRSVGLTSFVAANVRCTKTERWPSTTGK